MRSAISWLHWSGEASNIFGMMFKGLGDFPNFIFCIDDSTILADINGAGPTEGSAWDMRQQSLIPSKLYVK